MRVSKYYCDNPWTIIYNLSLHNTAIHCVGVERITENVSTSHIFINRQEQSTYRQVRTYNPKLLYTSTSYSHWKFNPLNLIYSYFWCLIYITLTSSIISLSVDDPNQMLRANFQRPMNEISGPSCDPVCDPVFDTDTVTWMTKFTYLMYVNNSDVAFTCHIFPLYILSGMSNIDHKNKTRKTPTRINEKYKFSK